MQFCYFHGWVRLSLLANFRIIAPQRAKRAGVHTKPYRGLECYDLRQIPTVFAAKCPDLKELISLISPRKQSPRKKYYILERSARTDECFSHLHFFSK